MKIGTKLLRSLIKEEILNEAMNHEGIRDVVTASSKLLTALTNFEKVSTGAMVNATSDCVNKLKIAVEDMIKNPGSYLEPSPEQIAVKEKMVNNLPNASVKKVKNNVKKV